MTDPFVFARLHPNQIDQAWPIIQSSLPGAQIESWRRFANDLSYRPESEAGIIAVQNGDYLHGLFSYAIGPHPAHQRLLTVDNFFVLDLFNPGLVADVLLDAVDQVARRYHCQAVHTLLPQNPYGAAADRTWLGERFRARGHAVETKAMCKQLSAEPEVVVAMRRQRSV